jgi:peptidoglycan/LPS O-acetylase OafA/YrhL
MSDSAYSPPHETKVLRKNRAPEVDLIRIISASLLFYFHTGITVHWYSFQWAGYVTGTFIPITTYCALKWSRHRHQLLTGNFSSAKGFIRDRFLGLYPIYAFFCLLIFLGSYLHASEGQSGPFSPGELGVSLLMINQFLGMEFFTNPMWFVPFVLQIYLLVPVLARFAKFPAMGMAGCTAISLILCITVSKLSGDLTYRICNSWSPLLRLPLVFLGVTFATAKPRQAWISFAVFAGGVLLGLLLRPLFPALDYVLMKRLYSMLAMILIFTTGLCMGYLMRKCLKSWDWLSLMGQATMPFFLSHCVMIRFIYGKWGGSPLVWTGYFVCCWLGSIVFVKIWSAMVQKIATLRAKRKPKPSSLTHACAPDPEFVAQSEGTQKLAMNLCAGRMECR